MPLLRRLLIMTDNRHGRPIHYRRSARTIPRRRRRADADDDSRLDALLNRIQQLTTAPPTPRARHRRPSRRSKRPTRRRAALPPTSNIVPSTKAGCRSNPRTLAAAGLTDGEVEALILKTLNSRSEATGRNLAEHLKLSFRLIDPLLHSMKHDRLRRATRARRSNDYVYQLTELGRERAKKFAEHCTYFGSAPVPLERVHRQRQEADARRSASDRRRFAPRVRRPADRQEDAAPARAGDQLRPRLVPLRRAGQRQDEHRRADHQGLRRVHLDSAGDRRSTARSCGCSTPACTRKCRCSANEGLLDHRKIDHRWIRIRRPTIVVGGELTMDHLEVTLNTVDQHQRSPAADEEQLRHAGDRRLRPPDR